MKTGTTGGYRAAEYDLIAAAETGGFFGKSFYCVIGLPGLWRRVRDPKVADAAARGILPAFYDGGIIYLSPDTAANGELAEGGIAFPDTPGQKIVADLVAARLRMAEPAANGTGETVATEFDPAPAANNAAPEPADGTTAPLEPGGGSVPPPEPDM